MVYVLVAGISYSFCNERIGLVRYMFVGLCTGRGMRIRYRMFINSYG